MNKRQEDQLSMFEEVLSFSNGNTDLTVGVPAYAAAITAFQTKVTLIKQTDQLVKQPIKGFSTNKGELKNKVCIEAAKLCKAVKSYASNINNTVLKDQVKYTKSSLLTERDEDLPQILNNIHSTVNIHVTDLATYGVLPARVTAFLNMITAFNDSASQPRDAIVSRKANVSQLSILFDETNTILKDQLDGLAEQVGGFFFMGYQNARTIVDSATRNTRVVGIVINSITNNPVSGIKAEIIVSSDIDAKSYNAFTGIDGRYILKIPKPGIHTINFTKTGYVNAQIADVKVVLGQSTTQNITMTPVS